MPSQELDFTKRRGAITRRIRVFHKVQRMYMPHVCQHLTMSQHSLWDTEADREPEAMCLFMPSDISDVRSRERACAEGLPDIEVKWCDGKAHEALESLRQGLQVQTMTNRFCLRNMTG